MKLPRFRLRTLLILVVLAGCGVWVVLSLRRRSEEFRRAADRHAETAAMLRSANAGWVNGSKRGGTPSYPATAAPDRYETYHLTMARKYDCAARYPFLPVAPDPPETE